MEGAATRWFCSAANDLKIVTSFKGNMLGGVRCFWRTLKTGSKTSVLHGSVDISLELIASTYLMKTSTLASILARKVVRWAIVSVAA